MGSFTLPSGRVLETREPLFGEELHVVAVGADDVEELVYAKCEVIAPGLSREEIAGLSRADGRALVFEVGRIWDGRPEEQEIPFEKASLRRSRGGSRKTPKS